MFEPKCPRCGRKATATGWSFPYAQWQCKPCKAENSELDELKERIRKLEEKNDKEI